MLCGVREAYYTAERGEDIAAGYDFAPRCAYENGAGYHDGGCG